MEALKFLRRATIILVLVWMRVNAERDIQCNGLSFECKGAYHYITCVNLPDGQRLYIPNRCEPGTICNDSNRPSEPCDSDTAPPTTLSTAPTSTADVPTTLGQATTSPYIRPTVEPSAVFSERIGELNVLNDTGFLSHSNPGYDDTSFVNVSFGVNITNNNNSPANASANVTASVNLESPSVIKTSSVITLSKPGIANSSNSSIIANKKSSVVETNTTIQKSPSSPQSSQFIINTLTQALFQFDHVRSQNVISFTSSQALNSNSSTISINVATGISDGGDGANDITLTTNTTVSFGQHDRQPTTYDRQSLLTQDDSTKSISNSNISNPVSNPKGSDSTNFWRVNFTNPSGEGFSKNISQIYYSLNKTDFEKLNVTTEKGDDPKNSTFNNEPPRDLMTLDLLMDGSGSGQPDLPDNSFYNIASDSDLLAEESGSGEPDVFQVIPEKLKNVTSEQTTPSIDGQFDEASELQKGHIAMDSSTIISMVKEDRLIPAVVPENGIFHDVPSTLHSAWQSSPMLLESLPTFNSENVIHEVELSNNTNNGSTIKDNKTISSGKTNDSTVLTDTLPRQDIADETNIQISLHKNLVDLEANSPIEDRYAPSFQPTKEPLESLSLAQNNQTTTGTSEVPNNTTNTAAKSSSKIDDNLDKSSNFSIGGLPTEPSPLSASTSFPSEPIETQVETTILPMMEPLLNEGQGYTSEVKNVTPNNDNDRIIDDTQLEMISSGQAQNKPIFSEIFESLSLNNRGADQDKEKGDEAEHSLAINNSFNGQLMTEVTEEEPYYDITIHDQHVKVTSTSAGEGSNNVDLETAATVQTVTEYINEATTVDYTTETVVQGHETTFSSFNMEEEIKTDIPPIVPATTLDSMAVESETYNQEIARFNESADNLTLSPTGNFTHFREEELGNLTGVTISPLATETTEEQPVALTRTGQEMGDGMTVIPAEESTLSPNWPDLEQINTHPVVSETTFDLPSSGGPVASEIPEDVLASQTDLPHEPFFRYDHLENGTHAEILGAGSNDSDLRKRELNKTTGNRQAKRLALFDETGLIVANSTHGNSDGKLIVDHLETTPLTDTTKVPSEELDGSLITNTQEPQQISSTGSSLQPPAEFVTSTVTSEKEAAILTELEQNLGASSTSNLDQLVLQIPSSNSSSIGVGGLELGQTSSSSSNKSDNWNEISTENPPTTVTAPELTTIIPEDLLDPYTTEPYTTLFPTEAPSIISVVTQSNLTEPVAPTVDGPLISGPLNVSDEQVALASSGDGVSNKTKEPFICTEHGVFPDIYDCKQYFLCVAQPGGYVKITGICPSRFAFNVDIQRCVRDVSSCYEEKCTREGNSTDPADDTSYFWCNEVASGIFHKYHLQCDPPMKFIQELNMCGDPNSVTLGGVAIQNETGQIINGTKFEDFKMETTPSPAESDQFPTTILIEPEFREMPATTNKYETAFIESFPVDDQNAVLSDPVGKTIQADDNPAPLSRTVRSLSEANLFRCPDEGIYAHPLNCSQYYMCSRNAFNEITEILRNCPERYAYRPDIKGCSRDLSGCLSLHVHCKGAGNFANPEDESSYYRCVPNATGGLRIYSIKCEGLKKFDSTRGACVTVENPASSSSIPLTVNKIEPSTSESRRISKRSTVVPLSEQQTEPKDRVLGYWEPVVSERYRKEAEGRLRGILDVMRDEASRKHEVKLDEKRYFDKMEDDSGVDTDEEVNESSRTLVVALRQEKSPEERATPSEFRCREEGRFPDPTDCKMYYICSARRTGDLKLHHLECRGSDRFDARKRICVEGEDASCA